MKFNFRELLVIWNLISKLFYFVKMKFDVIMNKRRKILKMMKNRLEGVKNEVSVYEFGKGYF